MEVPRRASLVLELQQWWRCAVAVLGPVGVADRSEAELSARAGLLPRVARIEVHEARVGPDETSRLIRVRIRARARVRVRVWVRVRVRVRVRMRVRVRVRVRVRIRVRVRV